MLQIEVIFISKLGRYYKKEQLKLQSRAIITRKAVHLSMYPLPRGQLREIDFANRLHDFPFIYQSTGNLSLGIPKKLNFCYNHYLDEIMPQPQTYLYDLHLL